MATSSASLGPRAQAIDVKPTLGPEHRRLDVFVGQWTAEGRAASGTSDTFENTTQQHTYEWLAGGFHLLHRWAGHVGNRASHGIEVIGYDPATDSYDVLFFDSDGWARIYQARARDRVWTFTGPRERCLIMFGDDGNTMTVHWDRSPDGATWEPLCDTKATRS
jgi:hypothetical protein